MQTPRLSPCSEGVAVPEWLSAPCSILSRGDPGAPQAVLEARGLPAQWYLLSLEGQLGSLSKGEGSL